jgi:hypothetical protein
VGVDHRIIGWLVLVHLFVLGRATGKLLVVQA